MSKHNSTPSVKNAALERAIEIAGSQQRLAELIGIRQQSVSWWRVTGQVPVKRAIEIERATGVSRDALCPEFFLRPGRRRAG